MHHSFQGSPCLRTSGWFKGIADPFVASLSSVFLGVFPTRESVKGNDLDDIRAFGELESGRIDSGRFGGSL